MSCVGIIILKSGVNVVFGQCGGWLIIVIIIMLYIELQGISGSSDMVVVVGSVEQCVGGLVLVVQIVGVVIGYGEGLSVLLF